MSSDRSKVEDCRKNAKSTIVFSDSHLKMEDSFTKVKEDEDERRILCDKCNYSVRWGGSLKRHRITVHREVSTRNVRS